jgi:hypothetical protein
VRTRRVDQIHDEAASTDASQPGHDCGLDDGLGRPADPDKARAPTAPHALDRRKLALAPDLWVLEVQQVLEVLLSIAEEWQVVSDPAARWCRT